MNVLDTDFAKQFVRAAAEGWRQGWHECNGGNLSYRLRPDEAAQVAACLDPGEWRPLAEGVQAPGVAGEHFLVTAAGSFFSNVEREPQACAGIIEVDRHGTAFRPCWGFAGEGRPTSELPSHLLNHEAKKAATEGACRVVYHAHPANLVALTFVLPLEGKAFTRELWKAISECALVFPAGVGVLEWMNPGSVELGRASAELMRDHDAVVWAHHGIICAGSTFDQAFGLLHTVEKASEILVKVRAMQPEPRSFITDENIRTMSDAYGLGIDVA